MYDDFVHSAFQMLSRCPNLKTELNEVKLKVSLNTEAAIASFFVSIN